MYSTDLHMSPEPIAVVGIGCRYPGGIQDMQTFWDVLINGRDVISDIPDNRLGKPDMIVDPARNPGKIVTASGGFLDNIDEFDASFFNISPREAEVMDPQQRVMLEITFEALEDAGIKLRKIAGSKTGVYVGQWTNDYENRVINATKDFDLYATTGTGRYATAGRISYAFNLQGPSMAVDTACSSSLVTIHLACQALRNGDIECGIAGGVNIILDPYISIGYSRSKILSDYGRCRFGDASGSGYVRSEGAGMVVLKRLSDAQADGDHIYGVIRGSCVNSDGQSNKYLVAPSDITQAEMLRDAYRSSGVKPSDVHYVEAHGTGTKAGDPIEFKALGEVIGTGRPEHDKCFIGSVKTNIGHTEAASGIAGFIKTILVLNHRQAPPSLHMKSPNPAIDWNSSPFDLSQKSEALKHIDGPLLAGVNSFGITGTNAHIILEEFINEELAAAWKDNSGVLGMPISANCAESLATYADLYSKLIQDKPSAFEELVHNIAFRKSDLHDRRFLVFDGKDQLSTALTALAADRVNEHIQEGSVESGQQPKTAFVFPGQGSQWIGMGRVLFEKEPVFREAILACEKAFEPYLKWKLSEQLLHDNTDSLYDKQDVLQPTLLAMEIALTRLWQSWGIEPDAVVGHSMGEVAAAYIAGSLALEDAAAIICIRSGLMVTLSGTSGMLYVGLSPDAVQPYIKGNDMLNIAINNSPESVVIGGNTDDLDNMLSQLEDAGVFCKMVKMDVASHSPQMEPLKEDLRKAVAHVKAADNRIPVYSSVQHRQIEGKDLDANYWVSNLRSPVQFSTTIQQLIEDGYTIFIEVSPHAVLTHSINENAAHLKVPITTIGSLKRNKPEAETFLSNIGKAYCNGLYPNWEKIYNRQFKKMTLPAYPWNREYFWVDETSSAAGMNKAEERNGHPAHPLLAHRTDLPQGASGGFIWETHLNLQDFPYLADHKVHDAVVFPAAGYLEMLRSAMQEVFGAGEHMIEHFKIGAALSLPEKGVRILQIAFEGRIENCYNATIRSRSVDGDTWHEHSSATVVSNYRRNLANPDQATYSTKYSKEDHYALAASMNFPYGDAFQTVQSIQNEGIHWSAALKLNDLLQSQASRYGLHPALLDGAIQVPLNVSRKKQAGATYLPIGAAHVWFADQINDITSAKVFATEYASDDKTILVDLTIVQNGNVLMKAEKLELKMLESEAGGTGTLQDHLYETTWKAIELPEKEIKEENLVLINPPDAWASNNKATILNWGDALEPGNSGHWISMVERISKEVDAPVYVLNIAGKYKEFSTTELYSDNVNLNALVLLVQALASREHSAKVWLITNGSRGFENPDIHLAQAPVWGMVNVLLNEHPELGLSRLDLSASPVNSEWDMAWKLLSGSTDENECVIRNEKLFAARLEHFTATDHQEQKTSEPADGRPYAVLQPEPGLVENLTIQQINRAEPAPDEVEIQVMALGINFMNLMSVLGIYPGKENGFGTLGIECAGIVTKTGKNVSHLAVGDEVMGMCYHSMTSHAIVHGSLMRKKPQSMSFVEAATIPVVFLTSYYALVQLGRIKEGERVLIHSATGGLGLSAIQIAQSVGAEIYATAGTEEKRALLRSLGIEHVYHSRTLDFADQIMEDTNGEGIDLVLNSLTGEAMLRSLQLLRSFGRFLEVGKKDVYDNSRVGLEVFSRGLSYTMIDLEKMVHEAPDVLGELMEEVLAQFNKGVYKPLQHKVFGVDSVKEAFTFMSRAQHLGKIIIELEGRNPQIHLNSSSKTTFDPSATYLLTGGYGGIGLTFTEWMVSRGARNLILVGRSGPKPEAVAIIERLKGKGAEIRIEKADVADLASMAPIIEAIPNNNPLKGIMHLAGFLDDAAIRNMTLDQYHSVLKPKINGAWHLHNLTKDQDLDFFLLFASSSLLFGSPGQSAYVAANAFLDQLSEYRKQSGLPSQSIEWGTVANVGLAVVDANQAERLEEEGVGTLQPSECLELYESVADSNKAVIGAFKFNLDKWQHTYRSAGSNPYYELLRVDQGSSSSDGTTSFKDELATLSGDDASEAVESMLKELISGVVKKPADTINSKLAFKSLGIDSLMSIQLKNKLEGTFEVPISVTSFWTYATIREYVSYLLDTLNLNVAQKVETTKASQPEVIESPVEEEEQSEGDISDDDISDLLAAELEDLG
ncbi:MAG: SDR family NAD(P)-dependent oxidoreductase [Bacteroidetes bacterium]|nr:SDR family NAD(P)-dependent oxidoreductase [Bacteroidota bacterium]